MKEQPIFTVPKKTYTGESAVVSLRLPKDMLKDLDEAAKISGRTRNELMAMAMEFALHHMVITGYPEEEGTASDPKVTDIHEIKAAGGYDNGNH